MYSFEFDATVAVDTNMFPTEETLADFLWEKLESDKLGGVQIWDLQSEGILGHERIIRLTVAAVIPLQMNLFREKINALTGFVHLHNRLLIPGNVKEKTAKVMGSAGLPLIPWTQHNLRFEFPDFATEPRFRFEDENDEEDGTVLDDEE